MRSALLPALWVLTLGGAFYLGTRFEPDAPPPRASEAARQPGDPAPTRPEARPQLQPAPGAQATATPGAVASEEAGEPGGAVAAAGELEPFSLEGVTTPQEASRLLMAHVAALLAKGEAGHLELLKFLSEHVIENKELERIFGQNDEQMAAMIYPWIKFLVAREGQVVGLTETVFKSLAERPEVLADLDDDALELFTEGVGFLLPGVVSEERLDTFRGYAKAFLARPEGTLPGQTARARRDVERLLALWVPPMSTEELVQHLRSGNATSEEVVRGLARLTPEERASFDLGRLLADAIARGDFRAINLLADTPLDPAALVALDQALWNAASQGRLNEWVVTHYLRQTGRQGWPAAQAFLEEGLGRRGAAANMAAQALPQLRPRPDKAYVDWVLGAHELEPHVRETLEKAFASR